MRAAVFTHARVPLRLFRAPGLTGRTRSGGVQAATPAGTPSLRKSPHRPLLGFRTITVFMILLPRNVCVLLLRGYRAVISPAYGQVCRYHPSCSTYALQAIQRYGVIRGFGLALWRIVRCNPWARGGVNDVPEPRSSRYRLTGFGFVVISMERN